MVNIAQKIEAEIENIEKTLKNLREALNRETKTYVELAAMAAFLHNVYNGIENILKQVLKEKGINITRSDMWHKQLLEKAVETEVIPRELFEKLFEYLSFRHFFVHNYSFRLEESQLTDLANDLPEIWGKFVSAIKKYRPKLD